MPSSPDTQLGEGVKIFHPDLVNLYGCSIGADSRIGTFVEIQKNASVGARCKISSHTFICEGVTIEDEVVVGHGVIFTNDLFPRATNDEGELQTEADWQDAGQTQSIDWEQRDGSGRSHYRRGRPRRRGSGCNSRRSRLRDRSRRSGSSRR